MSRKNSKKMFGKTVEKCSHTLCHMLKNSKKADKLIIKTLYMFQFIDVLRNNASRLVEKYKYGKIQDSDKSQKMINEK